MSTKSIRSNGKRAKPAWAARLATTVRQRRRALKLTQIHVAELAGCGAAFMYALENSKRTLRLDKVLDVLHVLGLRFALEPGEGAIVVRPLP